MEGKERVNAKVVSFLLTSDDCGWREERKNNKYWFGTAGVTYAVSSKEKNITK